MLKGKLYTITESTLVDQKINAQILLNKEHEIFRGHFPEIPILPGVCTLQIISDLLSDHLSCGLRLVKGDNIKFTAPVNPNTDSQLNVEITILNREQGSVIATCEVSTQSMSVFKMKGTFSC